MVKHFGSLHEFISDLPATSKVDEGSRPWTGNHSYKESFTKIWEGDKNSLRESEGFLNKTESDGLEIPVPSLDLMPTGFMPCIPALTAGDPDCMMTFSDTKTENSPIKVMVSVGVSAGLDANHIMRRGAAILALCRKLGAVRPVELYVFDDCDGDDGCAIPVIKVETNPLDLTTCSYIFGNPGFTRHMIFAWAAERGFTGKWSNWKDDNGNIISTNTDAYLARLRYEIGAKSQDFVIKGGFLGDPMIDTPLEWLNEQIAAFRNGEAPEQPNLATPPKPGKPKPENKPEKPEQEFKQGDSVKINGCRKGRYEDRRKYNGMTGEVVRKVVTYFKGQQVTKYRVKLSNGTESEFIPSTLQHYLPF